ncbi:nuclear transport factor 2 family protein [Novosphingobium aquimarinum]|uniref:nuclear transport factor 2 family protein n=1 Tax=Novosphingobium aquimarinum TaxID=2682494 RepID=UPI0012EB4E03|nr:nuclear transport factor 2 family protein [Novosphingobium aquimarinum]
MAYDLQTLSDIAEIRQLNARYNRHADAGEGEAFASNFTEDGEFDIGGNGVYHGREEIASAAAATQVTVHVTAEPEIEVTGDTANQRVRMLSLVRQLDKQRNEFVASGWYIDNLKRTPQGWRYARRCVELDLDIAKVFEKMGIAEAFAKLTAS